VRLVVDTNVWVGALLSPGPAREFIKNAPLRHVFLYHAEQLLELRDVAARPRLRILPAAVEELADRIAAYGAAWTAGVQIDHRGPCRD